MFNINNYPTVLHHLQNISSKMFKQKSTNVMMFCPFCDDATRKSGYINHGHCYIGTDKPLYNCFRCGASGTLSKLLITTGFDDIDVLKEITSFYQHQFTKDYFKNLSNISKRRKQHNIYQNIINQNLKFEKYHKAAYELYKEYICGRLGEIQIPQFYMTPYLKDNVVGINFTNADGNLCTTRYINTNARYQNADGNNLYYFQQFDFEKYRRIILTEGPIDTINLYCYNSLFHSNDSIFISVNGKKYISAIERLIFQYILIGSYELHLVFDNDVSNKQTFLYRARIISQLYNNNISIFGWKPSILEAKDVGVFPSITEV